MRAVLSPPVRACGMWVLLLGDRCGCFTRVSQLRLCGPDCALPLPAAASAVPPAPPRGGLVQGRN
eukprot:123787-Prymnesium_polylepis.2